MLKRLFATAAGVLLLAEPAHAQSLVTSNFGGTVATNFSQVLTDGCWNGGYCFTQGPTQVGANGFNVTFTSDVTNTNSGLGSAISNNFYGLSNNGSWNDIWYAGTDGPNGFMRFTFSAPVRRFGGIMNYAVPLLGNGSPTIRALNQFDAVIAEYDLFTLAPISTPGGVNAGEFRGIEFATNEIWSLELGNSYILIQDMIVDGASTNVVPEPSTIALMAFGFVGLAGVARRRATKA
jgi:hypothetical protein